MTKEDEARLQKLEQQINPIPMTNKEFLKFCGKGYATVGLGFGLMALYHCPKNESWKFRISYACGIGFCWPLVAFAMVGFTHR